MSERYKEAGVNLESGYESIRRIQKHVSKTKIKGAYDALGAFGGMFDLSAYDYKEPLLVSGTDGVGTKLLLAIEMDQHETIGIDAVAMCVNDVLVQGAMPLFFLDYLAVGKNDPKKIEQLVKGVSDGCVLAKCALIGGETAEMVDVYDDKHYDLAGFAVGVVEKSKLITNEKIKEDDVLIGLASSGCHSNGFSLIRKVLFKDHHLDLNTYYEEFGKTLGNALLEPTRIYVRTIQHVLKKGCDIHGMAHITGGGFYENLPRMLQEGQGVIIDRSSFKVPNIFNFIQRVGKIDEMEMYNVFNMGIGFVLAVDESDVKQTLAYLNEVDEEAYVIGKVTNSGKVEIV